MNRTFHPALQYDPNSLSRGNAGRLYDDQYDSEYGYYNQAQPARMGRPQYEDDYYDEPGKTLSNLFT